MVRFSRFLVVVSIAMLVSCGGAQQGEKRIITCDENCADSGLKLVEQGNYVEAESYLRAARLHLSDPDRDDIPKSQRDRIIETYRIAVAQAIVAHHLQAPVTLPESEFSDICEVGSWSAFDEVDLDFLAEADREWLFSIQKNEGRLAHAAFVDRAVRRVSPRIDYEKLAQSDDVPWHHLLAAVWASEKVDADGSSWNLKVAAKLAETMDPSHTPDSKDLFNGRALDWFLLNASSDHAGATKSLLARFDEAGVERYVPAPIEALGEKAACELVRSRVMLSPLEHADIRVLENRARCAFAVGAGTQRTSLSRICEKNMT